MSYLLMTLGAVLLFIVLRNFAVLLDALPKRAKDLHDRD